MAQVSIDRVLSCPALPSLPGIAMRVLELTRDPGVSIAKMALTVQTDPALASKVLRTVNSSFYALQTPCPNISRAMSLLGLNTVKSIVLGFSLVDCSKGVGKGLAFDMEGFWRRSVYSAAMARCVASHARCCDPEEAFVGALLQDLGVLACVATLKNDYIAVVASAPDDHDALSGVEKKELGFDHCRVGRLLGEKWRLPDQILDCVYYHHDADSSPSEHRRMVRAVALGGMAAATLFSEAPKARMSAFIAQAKKWFGIDPEDAKSLLERGATGAKDLAKTLDVTLGAAPDMGAILAEAHEQMLAAQEAMRLETEELKKNNEALTRQTITDGLTGAYNRAHYDRLSREVAGQSAASQRPYSVIFLDADKFKSVNDTYGHQAGDAVLMELSRRLREVGERAGTLCRYGGEEFVLLAPGVGFEKARQIAELLRQVVCRRPFDLSVHHVEGLTLPVTISLGVASWEPGKASASWTPEQVTHAADDAVYAAKKAGRNCVRWVTPDGEKPVDEPASTAAWTLLLVEDDRFTARILQKLLATKKDVHVEVATGVEDAKVRLRAAPPVHAVSSDQCMGDGLGTDLVRWVRENEATRSIPFAIMSGNADESVRAQALSAGADLFVDKVEMMSDVGKTVGALSALLASRGLGAKAA